MILIFFGDFGEEQLTDSVLLDLSFGVSTPTVESLGDQKLSFFINDALLVSISSSS